ncbi:MAG: alpha/beta hydrolase [Spartobacteria bacterium]
MPARGFAFSLGILLLGGMAGFAEMEPSSHFASTEGARVHYTNYGAGETALLFVHGWSSDETVWKKQAADLAKSIRVITVDLPGHGQSEQPEVAYTMDYYARALDAVLKDAGLKSVTLVGHSNGTPVVRQFYRRYPQEVRGLIIVDGALRSFGDAAQMEKFIAPLRASNYAENAGKFIDQITAPMTDPAERAAVKTMMLRTPQRVAVSEMEGILDPALWKTDKIEVPVLMVLAKSPFWTPEYEAFVRGFVPHLQYETFEGVSHFLMLDKPREFNALVLTFLQKNNLMKN